MFNKSCLKTMTFMTGYKNNIKYAKLVLAELYMLIIPSTRNPK